MADKSGKTEQPTQQRLEKAREEGQFPAAKEFVAALQFMVFLGLLGAGGADWFGQFRQTTRSILRLAFAPELRPEDLIHLAWQIFWQNILPLAMAGAGGCGRHGGLPAGDHPIRHQLQKADAGCGALQPDRATAGPAQAESAVARAGHGPAAGISLGRLGSGARQAGRCFWRCRCRAWKAASG